MSSWNFKDLTGQRFGRLVVVEKSEKNNCPNVIWKCICQCGNECFVKGCHLTSGHTKSCGCLRQDITRKLNNSHNLSRSRNYTIWENMKSRCFNPNGKGYKNYGGRGITICDEWLGEKGFENFYNWSMLNGYQDNLSIDRINTNGNYEPNNCRWATSKQQANNKRNVKWVTYNNETHTIKEWSKITKIPYETLRDRILKNRISIELALTTPPKNKQKSRVQ